MPYFAPVDRRALRRVVTQVDRCELPAGSRLQPAGLRVQWVWIVVEGRIDLRRDDGEVVESVLPGEVYGEVEALARVPAGAEAVVGVDSVLLAVPVRAVHALLASPPFADAAARRLACRAAAREGREPAPWGRRVVSLGAAAEPSGQSPSQRSAFSSR